ncbi:hypothetical protein CAOG_000837 [Capsaspora owczarzaki ATCC 30864]|uniref:DNA-directed RNA polymerase III subunit n=2 Tax=Capsaspora owczarzaki (strain ATCC 30864) TaxID=595528 RepID=A0A0D2WHY7_CAPO3|nr:hypothetical protein CAOG_000837 [Capsaspora owczarzaki ATCC 30864]
MQTTGEPPSSSSSSSLLGAYSANMHRLTRLSTTIRPAMASVASSAAGAAGAGASGAAGAAAGGLTAGSAASTNALGGVVAGAAAAAASAAASAAKAVLRPPPNYIALEPGAHWIDQPLSQQEQSIVAISRALRAKFAMSPSFIPPVVAKTARVLRYSDRYLEQKRQSMASRLQQAVLDVNVTGLELVRLRSARKTAKKSRALDRDLLASATVEEDLAAYDGDDQDGDGRDGDEDEEKKKPAGGSDDEEEAEVEDDEDMDGGDDYTNYYGEAGDDYGDEDGDDGEAEY